MDTPVRMDYVVSAYELLYADHCREYVKNIASLKRELGDWEPKSVLVVACGTGIDFVAMKQLHWNCSWSGFDLLPEMVEAARTNLSTHGIDATLWVGDLLEPVSDEEEKVDLIIFRGNSLSHFSPGQYGTIFANLYSRLKPGGKLIFDFRDGNRYFTTVPTIEQLGGGYLAEKGLYFSSFYCRKPSQSVHHPYEVIGMTVFTDENGNCSCAPTTNLIGYYPLHRLVKAACKNVGFANFQEVSARVGASLLHLRTFIATKGEGS